MQRRTPGHFKEQKMIEKKGNELSQDEMLEKKAKNWPSYLEKFQKDVIEQFIADEETLLGEGLKRTKELSIQPLISVILNPSSEEIEEVNRSIASIQEQFYPNWELLLLQQSGNLEALENRINERWPADQPIRRITDVTDVKGEYFVFVESGDTLAPFALSELVKKLNEEGEWNYIYTDEDKISATSKERSDFFFKPSWSPDLITSFFYTRHLSLYSTEVARQIGGIDDDFQGDKVYDFALRFTEHIHPDTIGHVARICYHRKKVAEGSFLLDRGDGVKAAIEKSLERRQLKGTVEETEFADAFKVLYQVTGKPLVSIVIPSKDNEKVLLKCLYSIVEKTGYSHYEVIVVDNGSEEEVKVRLEGLAKEKGWKYLYEKMPFNFSQMCNIGVNNSSGEYVLLLNDDMEVMEGNWLKVMLGQAQLERSGAVGAKLLYPSSDRIQHIGVVLPECGPNHPLRHYVDSESHYFGRNRLTYNYTGVTGACLLVEKSKYLEVGGMDETFPIAYNDVDLCIRLYKAGYYNGVRNDLWLYHHESISRGDDVNTEEKHERLNIEKGRLRDKHPHFAGKDPYYNPNLSEYPKLDFEIKRIGRVAWEKARIRRNINFSQKEDFYGVFIERILWGEEKVLVSGWALADKNYDFLFERSLVLQCEDGETIVISLNRLSRPELIEVYGEHAEYSGFDVSIDREYLPANREYRMGVWGKVGSQIERFGWTDKTLVWGKISSPKTELSKSNLSESDLPQADVLKTNLSGFNLLEENRQEIGKVKINDTFYSGQDLYSDGSVEDEMLEIAKSYSEEEYNEMIDKYGNWPVLYHFSHIRKNIISRLPLSPKDSVLEIGAGCGAITGALVEKAKRVVAVDLSMKRSLINAIRHKEHENLELYVGNFEDIERALEEKFDVITLIGVFEYAVCYISGENPYEDFLRIIKKHLKIKGKIIIAIENKFGLKYWAGCKEDHTGRYFEGVEGYKNTSYARTFSRVELEKIIKGAGFESWKFYYPHPDYKFPLKIFSDDYLPTTGELETNNYGNFDEERFVLFDELAVYDGLIQDGMYPYFANSFLVVIEGD